MTTDELILYTKKLTAIGGVSSNEEEIRRFLLNELNNCCDRTETDAAGNIFGFIGCADKSAKTLLLEAHMDRIGLVVSEIRSDGTVLFSDAGGIDKRILPYSEVEFLNEGKRINGIIVPDKADGQTDENSLCIFTGLSEKELKNSIKIGSKAILLSKFSRLCGNVISSGALDNRAGTAALINVLQTVNKSRLKFNIIVLFAVGEELGLHGAFSAAEHIRADAAIVVDVTHGMTHDTKGESEVFPLGCGAVICRGPNLHYGYTKKFIALAKQLGIPYRIEVAAGSSGTDAWALQASGAGIPSVLISIPLKYMHTNVEVADAGDIQSVSELICRAAEGGTDLD